MSEIKAIHGRVIEVIKLNRILVTSDVRGRPVSINMAREATSENARLFGHACVIAVGTPVRYSVEAGQVFGVHFDVETPPEFNDDSYTETSHVVLWHQARSPWGFAARECGCHIFVRGADAVTEGVLRGPQGGRPGTQFRHKIDVQSDERVKCSELELYQDI